MNDRSYYYINCIVKDDIGLFIWKIKRLILIQFVKETLYCQHYQNLGQAYRLSLIASCVALSADKIISFFRVEDSPPQVNSKSVLAHEMELGPRANGPGDHGPYLKKPAQA